MKRAREEEEARREMVQIDHITETLPREMVREVFHNMHVTLEERKHADGTPWHLNSMGRVSQLFYESITMVAHGLFKTLVKETRADFEAWGGYTAGRPLSVHERFDQSPLGHMGLSFPWCMTQFYQPVVIDTALPDALGLAATDATTAFLEEIRPITFQYGFITRSDMLDIIHWLFLQEKYRLGPENNSTPITPPSSSFLALYLYIRFAPFPKRIVDILKDELLLHPNNGNLSNEDVFRRILCGALANTWLRLAVTHRDLFMEWLLYVHGLKANLEYPSSHRFGECVLRHMLHYHNDYPNPGYSKADMDFFSVFWVLDFSGIIYRSLNGFTPYTLSIGRIQFTAELDNASQIWQKLNDTPPVSIIPSDKQWALYILRHSLGTLPQFARYLLQHHRNKLRAVPMWEHMAALEEQPTGDTKSID